MSSNFNWAFSPSLPRVKQARRTPAEVESRTQRPRPRTKKKKNPRPRPRTARPRTDPLETKKRNDRGQGQGPRTQEVSVLKKKVLQTNFSRNLKKKFFKNIFQAIYKILSIQKILLSSSRGLGNFRRVEASRRGQGL